jgi:predicted porin
MKKIIASTGLVALGVASLQAAEGYGQDSAKSWSLFGSLRGFYDSNTTASPDGFEDDSFGIGLEAGISYNLPLEQTFFGADYTYGIKWYEGRDSGEDDQSHKFNLKADHTFSERYKVSLKNSFVATSEPTVLDEGGPITSVLRSDSDALRNRANVDFAAQFTPTLGATIGYGNTWYDFDQEASDVPAPQFFPSRSQLLDRMEHSVPVEGRYTLNPETILLVGYQYGLTDYSDNDAYFVNIPGAVGLQSPSWRNNQAHYVYGGVEHTFTPQLNGAWRRANAGVYRSAGGGDDRRQQHQPLCGCKSELPLQSGQLYPAWLPAF